ncbi:MAG: SRPBCC family protein [Gemmatimonadota bacterium]
MSYRGDRVTTGVALWRIALGVTGVLAPDALSRMMGLRPSACARVMTRALGMRQLTAGYGLLRAAPAIKGSWKGVAGDALDLSVLAAGVGRRADDRVRASRAAIAIAGVAGVNIYLASRARRADRARIGASAPYQPPAQPVGPQLEDGPANRAASAAPLSSHEAHENVSASGDVRVAQHTVSIARASAELYAYWRDFANLPSFMRQLESVVSLDGTRSHWVTRAPGGSRIAWDTEIVADVPGTLIAWHSLPDAAVHSAGTVRFAPTASGRDTIVHLSVEYSPTIGSLGEVVARLFRVEPSQQVEADLEAFKALMDGGTDRDATDHARREAVSVGTGRSPYDGDQRGQA